MASFHVCCTGAQWLSGRVLDSLTRGKPHRRHDIVSFSMNINHSLVLVQPRKTRPFITEKLLMGHKESNQIYETLLLSTQNTCLNRWVNVNIFLLISFNICFGYSKEPSHWDCSFEYPQHMFWLRNKKIKFFITKVLLLYNVFVFLQ